MKLGLYLAVLVALLCAVRSASGEPGQHNGIDSVLATKRINPRFYVQVERNDKRSIAPSGAEEDELTAEEEAELPEDEIEEEEIVDNDPVETYYPVTDENGQTYLISESILQSMAQKQIEEDDSDTVLVPNGSVDLDDEESDDGEGNSAILLQEEIDEENELADSSQYFAIVQEPESYGKARRPIRRGSNIRNIRRRRVGGRRRGYRRGGSRMGLRRRRTRKRIRRGGSRGGGRRRIRRGGGFGGGGVRLGRIRIRRGNRGGFRF